MISFDDMYLTIFKLQLHIQILVLVMLSMPFDIEDI